MKIGPERDLWNAICCTATCVLSLILLWVGTAQAQASDQYQPVNKYYTAASSVPRPDLECLVGLKSMVMDEIYKVACNDAWNISIELDQAKANELSSAGYWSDQDRIRKTIRFGIKGSGLTYEGKFNWANWTRPVENWVCGYEPYLGVVIYDCIPSDKVPLWWDDVYMGPNFDDGVPGMVKIPRPPGCNGGVCYCNHYDYCNDRGNGTIFDYECPSEILPNYRKIDTRCIGNGKGKSPSPPE